MARATRKAHAAALAFDALTVEGALIAPAMLARIAEQKAGGQAESDYNIPKGLTLRDEIARYFRIGQALFTDLRASATPASSATTRFVQGLLRDVFGFGDIIPVGTRTIDERLYVVTLEALGGRVPVVVVPPSDDLDTPSAHLASEHRRRSAASAVQDWLNAGDSALWGLCSNGIQLRLVRNSASLTRPAFIQADLRRIFEGEAFADFAALWLLIYASRFGLPGTAPTNCALERWREAGGKEGVTARERLRDGVEAALLSLGGGFVGHPDNNALRERLASGALPLPEYFGQLLRLVYRLIFLLAAEDRNLLHPPAATASPRKLYAEGYSVGRLRDHAVRRAAWDRHQDQWEGLLIAFAALAGGEPRLGLPALGGLFESGTVSELEGARLANRDLMGAIYRLAWLREPSGLVPVNWRDMETEELGSVYEGLLELTPRLTADGHGFAFAEGEEGKGHARKTTGSYYTPDSLVQTLLDSALDPVLDQVEAQADDPVKALLSVTVVDPACGSGHFLLAAARRIATRVARHRTGGVASAEDYRHALREVARASIHGVDRNPLAVELTKVALWIETVEPGKPLGFLDANIRCGDSLLGVFDLGALRHGIPDAAYKPLTGDDKETAKYFAKRNKAERAGQGDFDFTRGGGRLPAAAPLAADARALRAMPEDSPEEIAAKRRRFSAGRADPKSWALQIAADLYTAAFLVTKTDGVPINRQTVTTPTTAHVWEALAGRTVYGPLVGRAQDLAGQAHAFHWPLEFPDVMAAGGFDVVLGNPPYLSAIARKESVPLPQQEFWKSTFLSSAGAYDLYLLFLEIAYRLLKAGGRACMLTPNKYLSAPYAEAFRSFVSEEASLSSIIDVSRGNPFAEASVYPIISCFSKGEIPDRPVVAMLPDATGAFYSEFRHDRTFFSSLEDKNFGVLLSRDADIVRRISDRGIPAGRILAIGASTTAAEADALTEAIVPEVLLNGRSGWKVVNTGTIDPFKTRWADQPLKHNKRSISHPWLVQELACLTERRLAQYDSAKIIVAKLGKTLECFFDESGEYAAMNVNFIFTTGLAGWFYAGQLNSKLVSWMYKQIFGALAMGGDFLQFQAPQLKAIPLIEFDGRITHHIAFAKLTRQSSGHDESIDENVFDLFSVSTDDRVRIESTLSAEALPAAAQ